MIESDHEYFSKIMFVLCETYNREFKAEIVNIYFDDLKEFSLETIERVAHILRRRSKYFPAISEFLDELIMPAPAAWSRAKKIIRRHSKYNLNFAGPDRAIGHTIEALGGMEQIDDMLRDGDTKQISIFGTQFQKTYEHFSRHQLADIVLKGWGFRVYGGAEYRGEITTTEAVPLIGLVDDDVSKHRDRCFELAAHDTLEDGVAGYRRETT